VWLDLGLNYRYSPIYKQDTFWTPGCNLKMQSEVEYTPSSRSRKIQRSSLSMQNNKIIISSMKCKKVNQMAVPYTSQEKYYTFVNGQDSSTRNILHSNLKMIVTYTEELLSTLWWNETCHFQWWLLLTHWGRVTQICVFNTVKLGTSASSP